MEFDSKHWKPTFVYPERYLVSDKGEVYNIKLGRLIKPSVTHYGYFTYHLYRDNTERMITAHRLVATAFIPNPDNKPMIDHINGIKTDNRVSNLRWTTAKENVRNPATFSRVRKNMVKSAERLNSGKRIPVVAYKKGAFVGRYNSLKEASRCLGLHPTSVRYCVIGKYKHTGEYTFKTAQDLI